MVIELVRLNHIIISYDYRNDLIYFCVALAWGDLPRNVAACGERDAPPATKSGGVVLSIGEACEFTGKATLRDRR
jgi:hypothetical protein